MPQSWVKAVIVEQLKLVVAMPWAQSIITIVIAFLVWRLSDAAVTRFFARRFISRFIPRVATYASLTKSIVWVVIMFALVLELLNIWKVNVVPALLSAGVVSVILAFGAQAIIRDLLAGVFFLFDDAFDVGDGVELTTGNGVVSGVVEAINLRETRVVDSRGAVVSVPNGSIAFVANTTRLPSRIRLTINVPLRSGVASLRERVAQIANRIAQTSDMQADHIAVQLDDVTSQSATFSISFHVPRQHATEAAPTVRERIVTALQGEGLLPGGPADLDAKDGRISSTAQTVEPVE